ncbi:MAG: hypothetical protein V9F01_01430 [Chitinophagaceae bacterium]
MNIEEFKINKQQCRKLVSKNPVVGNIATHLGDMYCIRALMTLFPEIHCLILYKENNEFSKSKLQTMFTYLVSGKRQKKSAYYFLQKYFFTPIPDKPNNGF